MIERIAYFNGQFVPESKCTIPLSHRAVLRGDTVFDATRTFNGKVFQIQEHLERLWRSLVYARIDPGMTMGEMEEITLEVVKRNEPVREPGGDYMVRQSITRGYVDVQAKASEKAPSIVYIYLVPFDFTDFALHYKVGAHVIFPRTRSYSSQSLEPKLKHYSRMNFSLAELETADIDPDALPVLLDLEGNIAENIGGNFFIVTNGVLRTPGDRSILQGVSRMNVLKLAQQLGIPTSEEDLQPYDAYTADEAFLANSGYCVLPVSRVDNRPIKGEVPGPVTKKLWAAWSEWIGMDFVDQAVHAVGLKGDSGR